MVIKVTISHHGLSDYGVSQNKYMLSSGLEIVLTEDELMELVSDNEAYKKMKNDLENLEDEIENLEDKIVKLEIKNENLEDKIVKLEDKLLQIKKKQFVYYTISNDTFSGSYQGSWSEIWDDTELTDINEAKEFFKSAKNDWGVDVFEAHFVDEIELTLTECIVPIDNDGDLVLTEQDANVIDKIKLHKN